MMVLMKRAAVSADLPDESTPPAKNISVLQKRKSGVCLAHPAPSRAGASRSSRVLARDAMDAIGFG
jgi:hypothetical protein